MESPVLAALANAKAIQEATSFGRWCMIKGVRYLPAMPAHVAAFVRECPREELCEALADVSRSHTDAGYADPTAGGVVSDAVTDVAKIEPPRSWPTAEKRMFERLPLDLQTYVAEREQQRDTAVRRAQNECVEARKALAAIQQPKQETTNGITKNISACA